MSRIIHKTLRKLYVLICIVTDVMKCAPENNSNQNQNQNQNNQQNNQNSIQNQSNNSNLIQNQHNNPGMGQLSRNDINHDSLHRVGGDNMGRGNSNLIPRDREAERPMIQNLANQNNCKYRYINLLLYFGHAFVCILFKVMFEHFDIKSRFIVHINNLYQNISQFDHQKPQNI